MHRNKKLAAALLVGTLGITASVIPATAATKKNPAKTIKISDIETSNGVIHVIDTVMIS